MKAFATLFAAGLSAVIVKAAPVVQVMKIVVDPGNAHNITITSSNTINATTPAPPTSFNGTSEDWVQSGQLPLALVNNLSGGSVNCYVTGLDVAERLVMLQPDGSFYYPSATANSGIPVSVDGNVAIPMGEYGSTTNITIPNYISSGRIWFAEGELKFFTVPNPDNGGPSLVMPAANNPADPSAGVNWGFAELTYTAKAGLFADISYVDFVGLPLGIELESASGPIQVAEGLPANAVESICADMKAQSAVDGMPWGDMCMTESQMDLNPLRVIAPFDYVASNPIAFADYWDDYIEQVWSQFASNPLTINTQGVEGEVDCTVTGNNLTCAGDNRGYAKPTAGDIFGCNSGPFAVLKDDNEVHKAVVPRLCAAFHRGTFTTTGGNLQPGPAAQDYYLSHPMNWYSKFVHEYEVDGKGYAFPYDDVNPDAGVDQAGVVTSMQPELLTVIVGGPLNQSSWKMR